MTTALTKADTYGRIDGANVTTAESPSGTQDTQTLIEGFLLLRQRMCHRRYCVLRGRVLYVLASKEDAQRQAATLAETAKQQIVVVAVKDALSLEPAMRAALLGRATKPKHVERSLVISTQKSKLVVVEADTPNEKLRWLHALSTLNLASISSERALCLSLLDDDKSPFDAHVAVSMLHKYRNNAMMVELVIERLAAYAEANVDDVEFYIPQIMHLLVNTDVVKTNALVALLLSICRAKSYVEHLGNSIHLALQLFWLLEAKIQDREPKTYNLCAHLLMSIEAKVVNQHLEISGATSADDMKKLLAKIPGIKSKIQSLTAGTSNTTQEARGPLPVESPRDCDEISPPPAPAVAGTAKSVQQPAATGFTDKEERALLLRWIESERKKRYRYFHEQRDFVKALTDISEEMRLVDPPTERKKHLPASLRRLVIPDMAYIPLGKVSDPFARIARVLSDEGTVFSTHSRAPCLICFEVIDEKAGVGTAAVARSASTSDLPSSVDSTGAPLSPMFTRANSASSTSSNGGVVPSVVTLDEDTLVTSMIKKLVVAGKLLSVDSSSPTSSESSSLSLTSPTSERMSESSVVAPLDELFNSSVKDLEGHWDAGNHATPASSETATSSESRLHDTAASAASAAFTAIGAAVAAGVPIDPCLLIRRQSETAYETGLSKLLTESGVFGESWAQKKERLRAASPHGSLPGWNMISLIAKSNDDIRQEVFAMQLITKFQEVFRAAQLPLWLRPYRIVSTGRSSGLLETITDAQSFDALKKHKEYAGLRQHFEVAYGRGDPGSPAFKAAQRNFLHSLAAYSLVCYLLQIKDRHNGNMLLDTQGHVVHIDFGFMLGIAPGGAWSLETAPFKLTKEMVEVLGGVGSPLFGEFVRLLVLGMLAAQRHADQITTLVEIMMHNSTFPCFHGRDVSRDLHKLRARFLPGHTTEQTVKAVVKMIRLSYRNKWTKRYDQFQKLTNGIVP